MIEFNYQVMINDLQTSLTKTIVWQLDFLGKIRVKGCGQSF